MSKKFITKTSIQAEIEKAQQRKDTSCPECGGPCLGLVATRSTGFWHMKTEKKNEYRCVKCNCEWNTGWYSA